MYYNYSEVNTCQKTYSQQKTVYIELAAQYHLLIADMLIGRSPYTLVHTDTLDDCFYEILPHQHT